MRKFFCFIFLFTILFPYKICAEEDTTKFRIGVVIAMSGEWANLGEGAKSAIELAFQDLPPAQRQQIDLIFEDDQLLPVKSVSAFHKLKSIDKVHALITWSSGTSKAVAPLAELAKIPMIAIASDPEVARGRRYVFNLWVMPEEETKLVVKEALRRGYSKIVRLSTVHDGALACRDAYDHFQGPKPEVLLDEEFAPTEKDFRTFIAKLRSFSKFDAIFVNLNPGQLGLFARQLRDAGVKVPLFGYETMEDANEVRVANGALDHAWFATAADPQSNFEKHFRAAYKDASIVTACNTYDALKLIIEAGLEASDSQEIIIHLSTLKDYVGACGTFSSASGNRFTLPAVLKAVQGSGYVQLDS